MTPRIVVGVDGSDSSKKALRWAAKLAQSSGATLDAVQSWDIPTTLGLGYLPQDVDLGKDTEKWLEESVDEVFGADRPAGLRTIVHCGSAARVLLDACKDAQLLVVGSRGHGGFYGLLLGSVSAAVAEHAPCPALVIHGDQEPMEFASRQSA
jgi:nucleotide-binding universal stress UspA family protein